MKKRTVKKQYIDEDIDYVKNRIIYWKRQYSLWGGDTDFEEYKRSNIERLEKRLEDLQKRSKK